MRGNADGARNVALPRPRPWAPRWSTRPPTTSSTAPRARPYVESDEPGADLQLRRVQARRARSRPPPRTRATSSSRTSWLFGTRGQELRGDDAGAGRADARGVGRARPDRVPDVDRPPGGGHGAAGVHRRLRGAPHGGRGAVHLVRLRDGDLRGCRRRLPRDVRPPPPSSAARRRARRTRCWAPSGPTRSTCPTGARACAATSRRGS